MKLVFNSIEELDDFFKRYKNPQAEKMNVAIGFQDQVRAVNMPHGNTPKAFDIALDRANLFIEKQIIFERADLGLKSSYQFKKFEQWLSGKKVEIIEQPSSRGSFTKRVYIPYYYENGVKILASNVTPRNKDVIKGAPAKPVRSYQDRDEDFVEVPAHSQEEERQKYWPQCPTSPWTKLTK